MILKARKTGLTLYMAESLAQSINELGYCTLLMPKPDEKKVDYLIKLLKQHHGIKVKSEEIYDSQKSRGHIHLANFVNGLISQEQYEERMTPKFSGYKFLLDN